jgi:osmotically-inducible protein OsmY
MQNKKEDLLKRIDEALLNDSRTKDTAIEIIDENSIITMRGSVPSRRISQAAEDIVSNQNGVVDVINALQIQNEEPEEPSNTPPMPLPRLPSS